MLSRLTSGRGEEKDIELVEVLSSTMMRGAFCGLGQAAPVPILGCLRYFKDVFIRHASEHVCAANKCEMEAVAETIAA